jgi:hypothetical protein
MEERVDEDYENLLVALPTNGYSQSQIERAIHSLAQSPLYKGKD